MNKILTNVVKKCYNIYTNKRKDNITMTTNIKEFKNLLKLTQDDLHEYLCEIMPSYYEEDKIIDQHGSFLYCQGEIPILMVAHLDTVHSKMPVNIFHDQEQNIMWSPEGIGGDDRCGVWSILEILDRGLLPSIVFTWNEEIGGVGASDFCTILNPQDLEHINFAIEIDRRGNSDCVFYDLNSPDFEAYIEEFNFKTTWGSFSDISVICPHFGFAGVNVSAGYFNEHTTSEYIDIGGMEYTIDRVCNILNDDLEGRWEWIDRPSSKHAYGVSSYNHNYYGNLDWYYDEHTSSESKKIEQGNRLEWCMSCQDLFTAEEMAPKPYDEMCKGCYAKLGITENLCQNCGASCPSEAMAEYPNDSVCQKCFDSLTKDYNYQEKQKNSKKYYCIGCGTLEDIYDMYEYKDNLYCRRCFENDLLA